MNLFYVDIDLPISKGHGSETSTVVDQSKVDTLISFGFQEEIARKALVASVIFCFFVFPLPCNSSIMFLTNCARIFDCIRGIIVL